MQDGIKIRSRLGDNISGYSVVAQYKEKVVLAIALEMAKFFGCSVEEMCEEEAECRTA